MSHIYNSLDRSSQRQRLVELAIVFLKLGTIGFGGPAAHVALMEQEVVTLRSWMSRERLLELFGITNLIPGPNSTELAMQIGYDRAGWRGLVISGVCFIAPAMAIVWLLAMIYSQTNQLPQFTGILYGIKPVIIAIIVQALWKLLQKALQDWATGLAGCIALGGYFLGLDEVGILLGLGGMVWMVRNRSGLQGWVPVSGLFAQIGSHQDNLVNAQASVKAIDWQQVLLLFLKIGSVLYGSGYVLLAFLQRELVEQKGWLTSHQLMDAVAVGQLTPGPVLTTATFIGYVLAGHAGAIAGTVGIFLPSFLLVAIINIKLMPWMRSEQFKGFLAGVTAASVGLMAGVTVTLMQTTWVDGWTVGLSIGALIALLKFKTPSALLVLLGGTIGWLLQFRMGSY